MNATSILLAARSPLRLALSAAFALLICGVGAPQDVVGRWTGRLDLSSIPGAHGAPGSASTLVVLDIVRQGDHLTGFYATPEEGPQMVPIDVSRLDDGSLSVKIPRRLATYEAQLSPDGTQLRGRLLQAPYSLALTLIRSGSTGAVTEPVGAAPAPGSSGTAWTRRPPLPIATAFAATVASRDGRIYMITGRTTEPGKRRLSDAVRIYDPRRSAWSTGASIPTPRTAPGVALGLDGLIYVVGGDDAKHRDNVLEVYHPRTGRWTRRRNLPTPREELAAVAARGPDGRGRIYALGGRHGSAAGNGLRAVEAYDPATDSWARMAAMPTPRHALTAVCGPDQRIYAVGGSNDQIYCTDAMEVYDPVRDTWEKEPPLPYGVECAAAASTPGADGEVLVLGGWDRYTWPLRNVIAYRPRTRTWRDLAPLPTGRAALGAVTLYGQQGRCVVYALGGVPAGTAVESYDYNSAVDSNRRAEYSR